MSSVNSRFLIPAADEIGQSGSSTSLSAQAIFKRYRDGKDEGLKTAVTHVNDQPHASKHDDDQISSNHHAKPEPERKTSIHVPGVCNSNNVSQPSSTTSVRSDQVVQIQKRMAVSNGLSHEQGEPAFIKASGTRSNTASEAPAVKVNQSNCIMVNPRQRGNPILKHIRNVPWEFGDVIPDYEMSRTSCAVFLSVRYHQLNPDYIHTRLKQLGKGYDLRVLLLQVDVKDPHYAIKELAKICLLADNTLMLAFSPEEAGRYLETYKVYENKPPDALMEKTENNYMAKLTDCLTTIKSVNRTDCMTLFNTFGCVEKMMQVDVNDLSFCPGIGPQKAKRIYDVFNEPFIKARKKQSEAEPGQSMSSTDQATSSRSAEKS